MAQAHEILDYVKEALIDSTMQNTFMDDATKARAKAKVRLCMAMLFIALPWVLRTIHLQNELWRELIFYMMFYILLMCDSFIRIHFLPGRFYWK